jgi:hypothetical protein
MTDGAEGTADVEVKKKKRNVNVTLVAPTAPPPAPPPPSSSLPMAPIAPKTPIDIGTREATEPSEPAPAEPESATSAPSVSPSLARAIADGSVKPVATRSGVVPTEAVSSTSPEPTDPTEPEPDEAGSSDPVSPTKGLATDGLTPRTMKGGLLSKEATSPTTPQPTESTVAEPDETEASSATSPLNTVNPKLLEKGALDGLRPATGADVLAAMATPEPELAFAKPQPVEPSVELEVDQDAGTTQDRNVILNHEVTYHPGQSGTPLRYRASETSFSEQSTSPQWQMYDTTPDFDLTPGAGPKTVYFQVEARIEADETDVLASQVVSDQIELAGPPAPGLTLILPDQVYSPQVSLDYSIDPAGASVQQWRSADTATELQTRAWRSIGTPLVHSVSPTAGPKTIHFQLRVDVEGALVYSQPASASTRLVIPTLGAKFEINNDDPATTNRVLTLNNAGHFFPQGTPGTPTHWRASATEFTEDGSSPTWLPYDPAPSFGSEEGYGTRTVYFQLRGTVGGQTIESPVVSDSIQLNLNAVGAQVVPASPAPATPTIVTHQFTTQNGDVSDLLSHAAASGFGFSLQHTAEEQFGVMTSIGGSCAEYESFSWVKVVGGDDTCEVQYFTGRDLNAGWRIVSVSFNEVIDNWNGGSFSSTPPTDSDPSFELRVENRGKALHLVPQETQVWLSRITLEGPSNDWRDAF